MMVNKEILLNVDEYLDLYLFAKDLGDAAWQQEIIEKLKNHNHKTVNRPLQIKALWESFEQVNNEILALYTQLRNDSSASETVGAKLWILKQRRIDISREIRNIQEKISIKTT